MASLIHRRKLNFYEIRRARNKSIKRANYININKIMTLGNYCRGFYYQM